MQYVLTNILKNATLLTSYPWLIQYVTLHTSTVGFFNVHLLIGHFMIFMKILEPNVMPVLKFFSIMYQTRDIHFEFVFRKLRQKAYFFCPCVQPWLPAQAIVCFLLKSIQICNQLSDWLIKVPFKLVNEPTVARCGET